MRNLFPLGRHGNLDILAAGPLSYQPSSMPFRVVLLQYANGAYSVHDEVFTYLGSIVEGNDTPRSYLQGGHYFQPRSLVEAVQQFGERVSAQAGYLASLFQRAA